MYDHDSMLILPLSQKHDMQIIPFWHLVLATECHYAIFRDYTVYATIKKLSITLKGTEKYKKMEKKKDTSKCFSCIIRPLLVILENI